MPKIPELSERATMLVGGLEIQSRNKNGIGTLGCIVFDKASGKPLGLTNRHILKKRRGFSVVQPGGKPRTAEFVIGHIFKKGGRSRHQDYAVFELDLENREYDKENSIYGLNGRITECAEPYKGMKVQKVGQFTGHTYGIVVDFTPTTIYIKPNPDKMTEGEEVSQGGDSGSLWVTDEPEFKAVGLHRAGEPEDSAKPDEAYAIPIQKVLKALNIRF